MKALKIVGIVLGSLVILILIFVGVAYALLNSTPATASKVTPVVASPEEAKQLDMKVDNFETTVKQAKPGTPVQLTLTQEEINSKIAAELSTADLPDNVGVSNVIVNLVDGEILGSAKVSYS
ncbi:MAG: hypothetical protein Q7T05_07655, partial [Dehalococcoidia bacterium]|nr:hypothetical protein [Dehalococcoidia bacterium]